MYHVEIMNILKTIIISLESTVAYSLAIDP